MGRQRSRERSPDDRKCPRVRVAHRAVFRPSEILAAIGECRPSVVFNFAKRWGETADLEVHAAWLLDDWARIYG